MTINDLNKKRVEEIYIEMEELVEISKGDPECAHDLADKLLCEVLRMDGRDNLVDMFEKLTRWCA
jgi:hypothetical protein